jgi:signal transduction histidine kinase
MAFLVLAQVALGARQASTGAEQATAALRLAMGFAAFIGPTSFAFVNALVGRGAGLGQVLYAATGVPLAVLALFTPLVANVILDGGVLRPRGGPAVSLLMLQLLAGVVGGVVLAVRRARASETTERRRQLRAVAIAYAVAAMAALEALRFFGVRLPPISWVFFAGYAAVLAWALRAHHLLDAPDLGWRSFAWFATSLLAVTPLVLVLLYSDPWSGWERPLPTALALTALYLLARGYVRRVQPAIDDLFQRRRRDLERDLDALAESLLVVRAVPALVGEVGRGVARALYVRPVFFAVRGDDESWRVVVPEGAEPPDRGFAEALAARGAPLAREQAAGVGEAARAFFARTGCEVALPLAGASGLLGLFAVAPRADGAPFVAVELDFLRRLAPLVAASLAAARLYDRRETLRRELEERIARRAGELAGAREALERAQDDIVRREKMATLGLVIGGVAVELGEAVIAAARAVPAIEADLSACDAAAARALAPDAPAQLLAWAEVAQIEHVRRDARPLVAAIAEGARRAQAIAKGLSLFARPTGDLAGKVDLARELDAVLALLEPELGGRIAVARDVPDDLPQVAGDAGAIGQVLMNLLVNAVQAIDGTGSIGVRARALDGGARVEIAIRDSGKGIAPEHRPRLFEPFFTTKPPGTRGGSGLGLFVSYGIVSRHGGEISVESEPGAGSEFRVVLPVTEGSH